METTRDSLKRLSGPYAGATPGIGTAGHRTPKQKQIFGRLKKRIQAGRVPGVVPHRGPR